MKSNLKTINILYLTFCVYRVEKLKSLIDYEHNIMKRKIMYNIGFNYSWMNAGLYIVGCLIYFR